MISHRFEWLIQALMHGYFMQTATWLVSRELTEPPDLGTLDCLLMMMGNTLPSCPLAAAAWICSGGKVSFYRRSASSGLSHIGRSTKELKRRCSLCNYTFIIFFRCKITKRLASLSQVSTEVSDRFYPESPDIVRELAGLAADLWRPIRFTPVASKIRLGSKALRLESAKRAQVALQSMQVIGV